VAQESERRQATVLFADISGFTAMSEKLDPEELTVAINRCFATLAEAVSAHGGHVDKYIGDCVMALFGVPHALEKAPTHAINAAIEMKNRLAALNAEAGLPAPLDLHIGINTGLVIAGQVGGNVKQEFTVMGDTVNLASRLKDAAPTGSIWVGPDTHRYTRDEFEFRQLEPLALKGKAKPVDAYELLSVKEQLHKPKPKTAEHAAELVGRDAELGLVRARIAGLARGGGGIINVIGEAGLGKSRLLAEACASDEAGGVLVLEGRSLSMGEGLSFHPFIDLFRHWAGIDKDDADQDAVAKLEGAVGAACGEDAGDIFPFVATLMSLRPSGAHADRLEGVTGEALEKLIAKSVRDLVQRLAAARPLLLVFEDLHWADASSVQLLEVILRLVVAHPVLFLHAFRPDHVGSDRILAVSRGEYGTLQTEIALQPLSDQLSGVLVQKLLRSEALPISTLGLITRTAEGNPFYLEQIVRSLVDQGVVEQTPGGLRVTGRLETVVIPDTIQGVILARVDRLPEPVRRVLQIASVLGRSFYHRILTRIIPDDPELDQKLAYLKERQLLSQRGTHRTATVRRRTLAEETEYVFSHALLQETIYQSILQKTRRELHAQVARAIEWAFADRAADFYGMLAYHYSRAEELEKAEEYLFKAGDEAARAAASSEALAFFREASRVYLLLNGEKGDPRKKAVLEKNIALALQIKGNLTESIEHFDRAFEHLGEPVPKTTLGATWRWLSDLTAVLYRTYVRANAHRGLANLEHEREICELFFHRGRAEVTSDPIRLFRELPTGLRRFNRIDPREVDEALGIYVSCAALFAYSGLSFRLSRRMLEIARPLVREDSPRDVFVYGTMQFYYHYLLGDTWGDEIAIGDELVERDLRLGQLWDVNNYVGLECDRRLRRGDFAAAERILAKLGEIADDYGFSFAGTNRDGMTALLLLERRELKRALEVAEAYYAGRHEDALRVFALGMIAKTRLLLGNRDGAEQAIAKGEEIVKRAGPLSPWHLSDLRHARLLADVAALEAGERARLSQARRSARRALGVARKVAKLRVEILRAVGQLEWARGRRAKAQAWWARSVAAGERQGALPELARTQLEMAHRLGAEGEGAAHLARARELFGKVGLTDAGTPAPASEGRRASGAA
jgi:class 3 adenylate cyclase/tetratricopeptide (TPR) repeat protein